MARLFSDRCYPKGLGQDVQVAYHLQPLPHYLAYFRFGAVRPTLYPLIFPAQNTDFAKYRPPVVGVKLEYCRWGLLVDFDEGLKGSPAVALGTVPSRGNFYFRGGYIADWPGVAQCIEIVITQQQLIMSS